MSEEELKQEAKEYADKYGKSNFDIWDTARFAYYQSAEPREKEIKSLGERCLQLQKDKGNLIDYNKKLLQENTNQHNKIVLLSKKVNDLQKENAKVEEIKANADFQLEGRDNEIRELKEQIKEMKGILLCTCEGCSRLPKLYKAFDKEIKEK